MIKALTPLLLCLAGGSALAAGNTSTYTSIDLDSCAIEEPGDEYAFEGSWRCKGIPGYDIVVAGADARSLVGFGSEMANNCSYGTTFSPFNSFGSPVEWRYSGKTPIAAIQRWTVATSENGGTATWLVVSKLADGTSCPVHYVAGSFPMANEAARRAADMLVGEFDCENDTPTYDSKIGAPPIGLEACSAQARE